MLAGSIPGEWEVGEIEQAGGKLVADATCLGDRAFHTLTAETGDLFNNLYQSCVAENLCPHRRPQLPTLKYLRQLTEEQKVEGIVYLTLKYCHPWGLSAPRIRQFLPEFPMLILDDDLSSPALTNFRTRVGAFVETLTSRKRSDREILHETKFQQTGV
jgi:benzoyl-CoA reductase/2-hydroxyglutaryl-CoA dehydratase subunit BcrC/BadD/HgdB